MSNSYTILFSDHFVVECDLKLKTSRPPSRDITYRKFRDIDKDQFSLDLTTNLSCCDTVGDFNSNVLSVLNTHAPVRTRTVTDRNHQPWYNGEIAAARRELRRRERQGCKDFRIYMLCMDYNSIVYMYNHHQPLSVYR